MQQLQESFFLIHSEFQEHKVIKGANAKFYDGGMKKFKCYLE